MSDADGEPDVTELLTDLTRSLQELQREVEPDRRLRPPTPSELSRFTSEIAIPGLILLLRTNVRALQLLQRTIRLAEGREPTGGGSATSEARDRAEQLGQATLTRVDDTLSELQSALESRPTDDETRELLSEARRLRDEIQDELGGSDDATHDDGAPGDSPGGAGDGSVDIDVESELRSIKDNLEDDGGDRNQSDDRDGSGDDRPDGRDGSGDDRPDGRDGSGDDRPDGRGSE